MNYLRHSCVHKILRNRKKTQKPQFQTYKYLGCWCDMNQPLKLSKNDLNLLNVISATIPRYGFIKKLKIFQNSDERSFPSFPSILLCCVCAVIGNLAFACALCWVSRAASHLFFIPQRGNTNKITICDSWKCLSEFLSQNKSEEAQNDFEK